MMERTGWGKKQVLRFLGISASQLSRWAKGPTDCGRKVIPMHILEEEIQRVLAHRTSDEQIRSLGYRKFTWQMVDEDIVYLSESAVYRVLRAHQLLGRVYKAHDGALKEYERKPLYVHHHWHTDIAYVIIRGIHYY
ncbi:MAG: hypothetical protein MUD12_10490 [Spirochaetes bacterium]|nr:hypothetical protein [Spirochaetota bacterium]